MSFQPDPNIIEWKLHLKSPPEIVYHMLATDEGRVRFWAEQTVETNDSVQWTFPGGHSWTWRVIERQPPEKYVVEYFADSTVSFTLLEDGNGGTDLLLRAEGTAHHERVEVIAGWVSVLMALKAAVDFGVDLRNHDDQRTWWHGYADN